MTEITILYDNKAAGELRPGWGFSALIRTDGATVMLDTGADMLVLEHNARHLGVNLESVVALALSHDHCDHIGAVSSVLHQGLHLYIPQAFARRFDGVRRSGINLHAVKAPTNIVPGVRSIGQMGREIPEQALLIEGSDGPVLVTGCAHMGIEKLVKRATDLAGAPMALVLGGFHLFKRKADEIERVITQLTDLGVRKMGACHCTGEGAIAALREAWGEDFVGISVGSRIEI
ncbi:MBL fold metallo-hydrolase [Candidatus Bipolaricaulota bacterium]|nr:MBL fold metallo-hydrolase [Candidatus Bipolaricaulota bacterium]